MSDARDDRHDGRKIIVADATGGTIDVPGFVTPMGVHGALDPDDGAPQVRPEDEAFLDPRQVRVHDLGQRTPQGVPDRRVTFPLVIDYGSEYRGPDDPDKENPYGQPAEFHARHRGTRVVDGSEEALLASHARVVGSEDQRNAVALTLNEIPLPDSKALAAEEAAAQAAADAPILEALKAQGVEFRAAGTTSGTGGTVTQAEPSVSVQGLTVFGAAAVDAALDVGRTGGTPQEVRDAALAASKGLPPPDRGSQTHAPPPPARKGPPPIPPQNKPAGYVAPVSGQVGLLGTLVTPASGALMQVGKNAQPIGTLPLRRDAQVALAPDRRGAFLIKDEDCASAKDNKGKGTLVKGWLQPDTSEAGRDTALPGETHKLRPVFWLPPPPPPPEERKPPPDPPPLGPPPLLVNRTGDYVPFTPQTPPSVVIPSPIGDGSAWVITHNHDDSLEITKRPPGSIGDEILPGDEIGGSILGGIHISPDGTVTSVGASGNDQAALSAGLLLPSLAEADAVILAQSEETTIVYTDSVTGHVSRVDPTGETVVDLETAVAGAGSGPVGFPNSVGDQDATAGPYVFEAGTTWGPWA